MKRIPNFFILGAPKCGTTSLAAWLAEHPNIYLSHIKEPHFFNLDGLRSTTNLKDYNELWMGARSHHLAIGEASTHYLYSKVAVPHILEYNSKSKFIVCVRNPIDMAQALHAERLWQGRETIKDFEIAWKMQEERRHGKFIPKTIQQDPERLQYGSYCKLGEQLNRLYSHADRKSVCVVVLDDLSKDPKQEYNRILSFLGLPPNNFQEFPVLNPRKQTINHHLAYAVQVMYDLKNRMGIKYNFNLLSYVKKSNMRQGKKHAISDELRTEMLDYFQDDVNLISKLLERNLKEWLS